MYWWLVGVVITMRCALPGENGVAVEFQPGDSLVRLQR